MIGAVTGEIVAGNRLGKKALLWGAVIASLPDLDVIAQPFLSPAQSLLFHRGPTHSIVFCALLVPILAKLLTVIHKNTKAQFGAWLQLSAWALFSHIFIDSFNTYGTAVFYPFCNYRVAFNSIGIIDIFLILPLLIALICFIFVKQKKQIRKTIARTAMLLSALYLCFTVYNKVSIGKQTEQFLSRRYINYNRILTSPLPLTNLLWLIVVEDEDGFFTANYSIKNQEIKFTKYFPKNHYLSEKFKDNPEFKQLVRFSKEYYCLVKSENNEIIFYDLRFASLDFDGTADLDKSVITHRLKINDTGELIIKHSYPKRSFDWEKIKKIF